jgi:hypothetical protein
LVVNEDWDHDENQKVSEEEELWIAEEDLTLSDDLALEGGTGTMLAVELQSGKNLEINKSAIADAWEMKGANEENQPQVIQNTLPSLGFYCRRNQRIKFDRSTIIFTTREACKLDNFFCAETVRLGRRPEDSERAPWTSRHGTTKWQPF